MGPYARWLAGRLLRSTLIVTGGAVVVTSVAEWVASSRGLGSASTNAWSVLGAMALQLPHRIGLFLPAALPIATVWTFGAAALRSEVVAACSLGVGPWRVARPAALVVAGVALLSLANQAWVAPAALWSSERLAWRADERPQTNMHRLDPGGWRLCLDRFDPRRQLGLGWRALRIDPAAPLRIQEFVQAERAAFGPEGWTLERGQLTLLALERPVTVRFERWSRGGLVLAPGAPSPPEGALPPLPTTPPQELLRRPPRLEEWSVEVVRARLLTGHAADGPVLRSALAGRLGLALVGPLVALGVLPLGLFLERARVWWTVALLVVACWSAYLIVGLGQLAAAASVEAAAGAWTPAVLLAAWGAWRTHRGA